METQLVIQQLTKTIDWWIIELKPYSLQQLRFKPKANSWSLGQVYSHLINDTTYYFTEVDTCLKSQEHNSEKMSEEVNEWFNNNSYPNKQFQGPPNAEEPDQPSSKEQLLTDLNQLKAALRVIEEKIFQSVAIGKTKHPGHDYFNATEWLQFADMHLRHHIRQKERIDSLF